MAWKRKIREKRKNRERDGKFRQFVWTSFPVCKKASEGRHVVTLEQHFAKENIKLKIITQAALKRAKNIKKISSPTQSKLFVIASQPYCGFSLIFVRRKFPISSRRPNFVKEEKKKNEKKRRKWKVAASGKRRSRKIRFEFINIVDSELFLRPPLLLLLPQPHNPWNTLRENKQWSDERCMRKKFSRR